MRVTTILLPLYAFQGEEQTYIGQEQYDEGNELKFNYFKKFDYSFNSCFFLRGDFTSPILLLLLLTGLHLTLYLSSHRVIISPHLSFHF